MTSEEFQKKLATGEIRVGHKGKLQAAESLFSEEVMTSTVADKKVRESLTTLNKLDKEIETGQAIFIPGNVPSSKNSYVIITIPSNKSVCCKAPIKKLPDNKAMVLCTQCNKVKPRGKIYTLGLGKIAKAYKKNTAQEWKKLREVFEWMLKDHEPPYLIGLYFIRDSLRIFDYINTAQIIQDIMAKGIETSMKGQYIAEPWIEDDHTKVMKPLFLGEHKDPNRCGVIIKVMPEELKTIINSYI